MKELMKNIRCFVIFDEPFQTDAINLKFKSLHDNDKSKTDYWSTTSTRHKMISEYWYNSVVTHFCFLLTISFIIILTYSDNIKLLPVSIAAIISFVIVYIFTYKRLYSLFYLPNLETIKEEYEQKLTGETKKCRQNQLPNFTLLLVQYAMLIDDQTSFPTCNDHSASMLAKMYGVDPGSMKKCLELLFLKNKRKNLTERQKTEYRNRFGEAHNFLEGIQHKEGVKKLRAYETNFFNL